MILRNYAETRIRLQRQLDLISEFCQETSMTVNLNKTEIIVFRNGGSIRNYESWTFNGLPVRTTLNTSTLASYLRPSFHGLKQAPVFL